MGSTFDGRREPMRALRDLISLCERTFPLENGGREEQEIIAQAQNGFTTLRRLLGDDRPADQIADVEAMIEPGMRDVPAMLEALRLTSGALNCMALKFPAGERHVVTFTGAWERFGSKSVGQILDQADTALKPMEA